jgi:hypothetical protein
MRMRFILSALIVLGLGRAASAEINPIYSRLKTLRTYYSVGSVDKLAHRFSIWYSNIEPSLAQVAGNTVEDMQALTEKDLHISWGAFGIPPSEIQPVPPALKAVADAAVARLKELQPNASEIQIGYYGKFRQVHINEMTPIDRAGGPADKRIARKVELSAKLSEEGTITGLYGFSSGGYGLMAWDWENVHPFAKLPQYVNYALPANLEGTSPLYAHHFHHKGDYEEAYEKVIAEVLKTVAAIDAGTYKNPIEELLAAQGESLLPAGFDAHLKYEVRTYARAANFPDQKSEEVVLRFSLKKALAAPVHFVETSPMGIKYDLTIDLTKKLVSLTVTNSANQSASRTYPVVLDNHYGGVVTEGDATALLGGTISVKLPHDLHDLHVPGTGGFSEFDVYPESAMWESFIHGEEGGVIHSEGKPKQVPTRTPGVKATQMKTLFSLR